MSIHLMPSFRFGFAFFRLWCDPFLSTVFHHLHITDTASVKTHIFVGDFFNTFGSSSYFWRDDFCFFFVKLFFREFIQNLGIFVFNIWDYSLGHFFVHSSRVIYLMNNGFGNFFVVASDLGSLLTFATKKQFNYLLLQLGSILETFYAWVKPDRQNFSYRNIIVKYLMTLYPAVVAWR
jgi:hypothetical protein